MGFDSPDPPVTEQVDQGTVTVPAGGVTTVESGIGAGEELTVFWGINADPDTDVRIRKSKAWDDATGTQEIRWVEEGGNAGAELTYVVYKILER
jgi:hypothetical protein